MSQIELYECDEPVFSIAEFIRQNIKHINLTDFEMGILSAGKWPQSVPSALRPARTIARWLAKDQTFVSCNGFGRRSAYWPENQVKLKGCAPIDDSRTFPSAGLFFGFEAMQHGVLPFGVMTPEQVMRELLGYAFFCNCGMPVGETPVCVYGQSTGFCLVLETVPIRRAESFLVYNDLTISSLIEQDSFRKATGLKGGLSQEIGMEGVNVQAYIYKKAKLLITMNFAGGFRDLLNSNIGNDLLHGQDVFLGDLDTFHVVEIPKKPDSSFLARFYLQSFVEMIKGSLPIIDLARGTEQVVSQYVAISTLHAVYRRMFMDKAKQQGWDLAEILKIEAWARTRSIFGEVAGEIVPMYETLRGLPQRDPTYLPH